MTGIKKFRLSRLAPLFMIMLIFTTILVIFLADNSGLDVVDLNVGVILNADVNEPGWNHQHFLAIQKSCREKDVVLHYVDKVPEEIGPVTEAINSLVKQNCRVIFLACGNYADIAKDVILSYQGIHFVAIHALYESPNLTTYIMRDDQTLYLAGMLAGKTTVTNEIAYVAVFPTTGTIWQADAFTLGVQKVNPDAKVYITWTYAWSDPEKAAKTINSLHENTKVDTLVALQNQMSIRKTAEAYGIKCILDDHPAINMDSNVLAMIKRNWNVVYEILIKYAAQKKLKSIRHFMVGLPELALELKVNKNFVNEETGKIITEEISAIMDGKFLFTGPLYDINGEIICEKDEIVSDDTLMATQGRLLKGIIVYDAK